jgi:hypothetical protein
VVVELLEDGEACRAVADRLVVVSGVDVVPADGGERVGLSGLVVTGAEPQTPAQHVLFITPQIRRAELSNMELIHRPDDSIYSDDRDVGPMSQLDGSG